MRRIGAFLWSIHIKDKDADAVRTAVAKALRHKAAGVRITSPSKGWVSVYPDHDSVDETTIRRIASGLKAAHAIAFHLHDSDVLRYWYFRDGVLADEFNSCPDYFGSATKKSLAAAGDPAAFDGLLDQRARARLGKLIGVRMIAGELTGRGTAFDVEEERLAALQKLLGIPAAADLPSAARRTAKTDRSQPLKAPARNPSPTIAQAGGFTFTLGAYTVTPDQSTPSARPKKKTAQTRASKPKRRNRP